MAAGSYSMAVWYQQGRMAAGQQVGSRTGKESGAQRKTRLGVVFLWATRGARTLIYSAPPPLPPLPTETVYLLPPTQTPNGGSLCFHHTTK